MTVFVLIPLFVSVETKEMIFSRAVSTALLWFTTAVSPVVWASPKDLTRYLDPIVGLVELQQGTVVEGSKDYGGITPDYFIDWESSAFVPLKQFCKEVREKKISTQEKIKLVRDYIKSKMFSENVKSSSYVDVLMKKNKLDQVPLSEFALAKAGACREKAYILHLALKEIGIMNKVAYLKSKEIIENSNDHALAIYRSGKVWKTADAATDHLHDAELSQILSSGQILHLNLYPRYWHLRENPFLNVLKKFKNDEELKSTFHQMFIRIPDLAPILRASEKNNLNIKFGGGMVRGAFRWMLTQLQHMSITEFQKLTPPTTSELLLNPWADRDAYVSTKKIEHIKAIPELKGWELTDEKLFESSITAGGGSLDKLRVSKKGIEDPLEAIPALLQGYLEFKMIPNDAIQKTYWFKEQQNTHTAMILRYLRVLSDFPEFKVPDTVVNYIKSAAKNETANLKIKKDSIQYHWIQKALTKLFESTFVDPVMTGIVLRKYDLLIPLSKIGFELKIESSAIPVFDDLELSGWTQNEIASLKALFNTVFELIPSISVAATRALTEESTLKILRRAIIHLKTPEDYVNLFSAKIENFSINEKAKKIFFNETLDEFLKLRPTSKQTIEYIMVLGLDESEDLKLYIKKGAEALSALDYASLFGRLNGSLEQLATREKACRETFSHFLKLKPKPEEVQLLLTTGQFSDELDELILKQAAEKMETVKDFIKLLSPIPTFLSKGFQRSRDRSLIQSVRHFYSLNPSLIQIEELIETGRFSDEADAQILKHAKPFITKEDYKKLTERYPKTKFYLQKWRCAELIIGIFKY